MSEMTDAEFMRLIGRGSSLVDVTLPQCKERCNAIADLLDARQWRDEPPDTAGWWLRSRRGNAKDKRVQLMWVESNCCQSVLLVSMGVHRKGDRWLKVPE